MAAGTLAMLVGSGTVLAQDTVRLSYDAPETCPTDAEFRSSVLARLKVKTETWPHTTFSVSVVQEGERVVARLTFHTSDGEPVERSVEDETCVQAVDAIALVTALAIDAWVEEVQQTEPETAPEPEPEVPETVETAVTEPEPVPTPVPPPQASPVPDIEPPSVSFQAIEVGAHFASTSVHGPQTTLGGLAFFGVRLAEPWPGTARIGLGYDSTGAFDVRDGDNTLGRARFEWVGTRLELCPYYRAVAPWLLLDACAALEMGALFPAAVTSSGLSNADTSAVFWAAGHVGGRAQFVPARLIRVELQLGAVLPFHDESYRFLVECPSCTDDVEAYRAPALGWAAGVGVAFAFR